MSSKILHILGLQPRISQEHFFLTVGQNNFGNKILFKCNEQSLHFLEFELSVLPFLPYLSLMNWTLFPSFKPPGYFFQFNPIKWVSKLRFWNSIFQTGKKIQFIKLNISNWRILTATLILNLCLEFKIRFKRCG